MDTKRSILIVISVLICQVVANTKENEWNYKFSYTANVNSQMSLDCGLNKAIWIGWSHYGTRSSIIKRNSQEAHVPNPFNNDRVLNFPNEKDCWMNFTEKIAEQCNGAQHCDLSSQPTYIHKCGKISDYLYVSYKCISENNIFDICKSVKRTFTQRDQSGSPEFYIKSSDFPDEYPWSLDCSCAISSSVEQPLKMEVLWFSLQDNDYLNMFNKNLTGWINPTYEMPIMAKTNRLRFLTDDALAYKGFWLKVSARKACRDDWQLVGDTCIKVFSNKVNWRSANRHCKKMNGNLLKINDVTSDLKLTQYMKSFYPEVTSYWIGLRKYVDSYSKERWMWSVNSTNYNDVSWWPWTPKVTNGQEINDFSNNCVVKRRNKDGYFTTSCDSDIQNSFVCQTETIESSLKSDIQLKCGQTKEIDQYLSDLAKFEKIGISSIQNYQNHEPKIIETTSEKSVIIQPIESDPEVVSKTTVKAELLKQFKSSSKPPDQLLAKLSIQKTQPAETAKLNTTVLAGIIAGIGLVIVLINLGVLFICRRNLKKFLKSSKTDDDKINNTLNPSSDILQDYFEAFNTLHNMKNQDPKLQLKMLNEMNTALTLQHQMKTLPNNQNRTISMSSGDEPLMNDSAKQFYNSQFFKNMTVKQTEAALANTSAFKPFIREVNDKTLSQQQLLQPINQSFMNQSNQYDKITHIQPGQTLPYQDNQYAHTYECLDDQNNQKNRLQQLNTRGYNQASLQSPTENINVSTSSTSSSSGASSTQHLIRQPHGQNKMNIDGLVSALTPAQIAMVLNQQEQSGFKCVCGANSFGDMCTNCGNSNGSWSPDSAYYSSIPNYAQFNNVQNNPQMMNQQQQFTSFNFNSNLNGNENFKSHLV